MLIKEPLCETCLSSGRKLNFIDPQQLNSICLGLHISVRINQVCWECRSMVHKWVKFRKRVVKAQELLADCTHKQEFTSLSNLCLTEIYTISTIPPVKIENKMQNMVVAIASRHGNESIEPMIPSLFKTDDDTEDLETDCKIEFDDNSEIQAIPMETPNIISDPIGLINGNDTLAKEDSNIDANSTILNIKPKIKHLQETSDVFNLGIDKEDKLLKLMLGTKPKTCSSKTLNVSNSSIPFVMESNNISVKKYKESASHFSCEICGHKFPSQVSADVHKKTHIDKSAKPKRRRRKKLVMCSCDHCGEIFTKDLLKEHIRKEHTEKIESKCPICLKVFKGDLEHLEQTHMKRAHRPLILEESLFCVECDVLFKNIQNYRSHVKIKHENEKSECPKCGGWFAYLTSHLLSHAEPDKYSCGDCGKNFRRRSTMLQHVKYHHRGVPKPRNKTCTFCQKSFNSTRILKDHMNTHTGDRPYVCSECGDNFRHTAALYTHTKLKHGLKKSAGK